MIDINDLGVIGTQLPRKHCSALGP